LIETPRPQPFGRSASVHARVLAELLDLLDVRAGAVWGQSPGATPLAASSPHVALTLIATVGDWQDAPAPPALAHRAELDAWCRANGAVGTDIDAAGWTYAGWRPRYVAVASPADSGTRPVRDSARVARWVRHAARVASLEMALEEERSVLTAVLENGGDAIVAVDANCRVVWGNAAVTSLLGRLDPPAGTLTCGEFLGCGTNCHAGVDGEGQPGAGSEGRHRSTRPGAGCLLHQVLNGSPSVVVVDETEVGPAGARVPASAAYVRIGGGDIAAVAIFRDLRAGQALDMLKSSFVAAVSHELRTPLAIISGYAQSLLSLDLDEAARRNYVERIDGTTNRMRSLVDQLLDVTALESDSLAVDPRRVSIGPLLKSMIDEVAEIPGSLGVTLSVPPDLPPVYADPARLGQVVANLLQNANKYGTPGTMVSIRVHRTEDRAVVSVENDGPEISPEAGEALFDRFVRGPHARSSSIPGIGLGLYLSRRLVEALGGEIGFERRPGGACLVFTLPLAGDDWAERGRRSGFSASGKTAGGGGR